MLPYVRDSAGGTGLQRPGPLLAQRHLLSGSHSRVLRSEARNLPRRAELRELRCRPATLKQPPAWTPALPASAPQPPQGQGEPLTGTGCHGPPAWSGGCSRCRVKEGTQLWGGARASWALVRLMASTLQGSSTSADVWLGRWPSPSARVSAPYSGGREVRSMPEQAGSTGPQGDGATCLPPPSLRARGCSPLCLHPHLAHFGDRSSSHTVLVSVGATAP